MAFPSIIRDQLCLLNLPEDKKKYYFFGTNLESYIMRRMAFEKVVSSQRDKINKVGGLYHIFTINRQTGMEKNRYLKIFHDHTKIFLQTHVSCLGLIIK